MTPKNGKIKVALAEDNDYFCQTVENLLSGEACISFTGHAPTIDSFKATVIATRPHLALLDLDLVHPRDGVEILKWLLQDFPEIKSVILTTNEREIAECYQLGAKGYILKSNLDNLTQTVRMVYEGSLIIPPGISNLLIDQMREQADKNALKLEIQRYSHREIDILKCLKKQKSRKEIADFLFISELTVKRHIENILKKSNQKSVKTLIGRLTPVL